MLESFKSDTKGGKDILENLSKSSQPICEEEPAKVLSWQYNQTYNNRILQMDSNTHIHYNLKRQI